MENKKHIAILGGGPSGLFMFKRLVDSGTTDISVTIFEQKKKLGVGMPYSIEGANDEHITNVSSNEIPKLVTPIADWLKSVPKDTLDKYQIDPKHFNEYKVLPRLLFGQYLTFQFDLLQKQAQKIGIDYQVHYNSQVTDIIDNPKLERVMVEINGQDKLEFDRIIICTGHNWPHKCEGKVPGYFDSPYPPAKLAIRMDHPIAIKGSSLTAVDAIRTLARYNGTFDKDNNGRLSYQLSEHSLNFKLVLHTRNGMLPAVRFHLEDSHLSNDSLLSKEDIAAHRAENNGFLSLDYVFEYDFKFPIKEKQPEFYAQIKDMNLEQFVTAMTDLREQLDPFQLLKVEYAEAEQSIRRKESIYWKEMLGVLSFALNYPAKHLSAEDMQRLQKFLMPLISIVIAYIPQSSSEELLALHQAGVLDLISVGDDGEVEAISEGGAIYHYTDETGKAQSVYFKAYINCVGQPHLQIEDFPFKSLLSDKTVSPAKLKFRSAEEGQKALAAGKEVTKDQKGNYYLKVPGITINDHFQVVDDYGAFNDRIYIMAVPYIGGYNPDYSGLDFSEAASAAIIKQLLYEDEQKTSAEPKLFMILLGSKAPNRNVEQHDYFFGIAGSLKELVPAIRAFWPEAGNSIHLDGWREVNCVNGYQVKVVLKHENAIRSSKKLFFINLGGYQSGKLEEQHYTALSVHDERPQAILDAKKTVFFKTNTLKGASSHIDEKYGIDVDDIYRIEDILAPEFKDKYHIMITPASDVMEDTINLGYISWIRSNDIRKAVLD